MATSMVTSLSAAAVAPLTEYSKDENDRFKMVLIGETGAGKTSFVNLLCNYGKQLGSTFNQSEICRFTDARVEADTKSMESKTNESFVYQVEVGELKMDIFDTPGFADTRGIGQTHKNIANIISKVREDGYIHCICLVINGTQSRLTSLLKEIISQILTILPKEAVQNVLVVFTKTSDYLNQDFDVEILSEFGLNISQRYIFSVDNPYARYEKAQKKGITRAASMVESEFGNAFKMLGDMCSSIKNFEQVFTIKFGEFRIVLDEVKTNLAELCAIHDTKERYETRIKQIEKDIARTEDFEELLKREFCFKRTHIVTTKLRSIICETPKCYSNCHVPCRCRFTGGIFNRIKKCKHFQENGMCMVCDHHHSAHSKSLFYYENETVYIKIPSKVQDDIDSVKCHENLLKQEQQLVLEEDQKIEEVTEHLVKTLDIFQRVVSSSSFVKVVKEEIDGLKQKVDHIPGFGQKVKVQSILDNIACLQMNHARH